jgi:hypothetical protein
MFWKKRKKPPEVFTGPLLRCSFCNKSQREVAKIVAGPRVNICSECVEICRDVLDRDVKNAFGPDPGPEAVQRGEDLISGKNAIRCALCSAIRPLSESIQVPFRGWLCKPCALAAGEVTRGSA